IPNSVNAGSARLTSYRPVSSLCTARPRPEAIAPSRASSSRMLDLQTDQTASAAMVGNSASTASAYHASSRTRNDLRIDDVPSAAARPDQVAPELPSEAGDIDIDHVRHRGLWIIIDVLVQHRSTHELAAVKDQELED